MTMTYTADGEDSEVGLAHYLTYKGLVELAASWFGSKTTIEVGKQVTERTALTEATKQLALKEATKVAEIPPVTP